MSRTTEGLQTIDDLDVEGRRVLLRADLNVPLTPRVAGAPVRVADDTRIRSALPTIEELRRRGARLVLMSDLAHPHGRDPALSMRPVAERLAQLTGVPVPLAPAVIGRDVLELTSGLEPGGMLMLENLGFEWGEAHNDPALASGLAELADLYVNDAFAGAARAHASTEAIAHRLPCAAGRLMEREVLALNAIIERPVSPVVAVLGGTNVHEKIGVVHRFLEFADKVCVGGALCFAFLAGLGHRVGGSHCLYEDLELVHGALVAAAGSDRLELPQDFLVTRRGETEVAVPWALDGRDVPADWMAADIGPRTAARYAAEIERAGTVFWYGPMGRLERPTFARGTRTIANAVASTPATTVVSGHDTVHALRAYGLQDYVSHVSTGDRAALAFIEAQHLPAVQALLRAPAALATGSSRRCAVTLR